MTSPSQMSAVSPRPSHLAIRCVVAGGVVAWLWFRAQGFSSADAWALLTWDLPVESDGEPAWQALPILCGLTLMLTLASMALSTCMGVGVAYSVLRFFPNRWVASVLETMGDFLAALPIVGLAWCSVGWIVNDARLPIESLTPYIPPLERDTRWLAIGRAVWSWIVPAWVLAVPLTGMWLSAASTALSDAMPIDCARGLTARGISPGRAAWHHWFQIAWVTLLDCWHTFGLVVFAWTLLLCDAFGLPGWGGFTARCIHEHSIPGCAAAIYALGWMTAAWHLLSLPLRHLMGAPSLEVPPQRPIATHAPWWQAVVMCLVFAVVLSLNPSPTSWINGLMVPWIAGMMPDTFGADCRLLFPRLLADLNSAGWATMVAMVMAICVGGAAAFLAPLRRLSLLRVLDTLVSCPLAAWALTLTSVKTEGNLWFIPGLALATSGAVLVRDGILRLRAAPHVQASQVSGSNVTSRWMKHVVPELSQVFCAWAMQTLGTALLWVVLIGALITHTTPAATIGATLAQARATVLTTPASVSHPTWLTALAVLCFWRLSRALRPVPIRQTSPSP